MEEASNRSSEVTKGEFDEWKQHPVTRAFFEEVRDQRNSVAEQLESGRFIQDFDAMTRAVLAIQIYDQLLNAEFDDDHEH